MNSTSLKGEGARALAPNPIQELLALCRDSSLFPLVRELLFDGVARLRIRGALPYFEYELVFRETVIASDEQLAAVYARLGAAIGNPDLKATPQILPGLEAQETLVLPSAAKATLMRMFVQLAGELANPENGDQLEGDVDHG